MKLSEDLSIFPGGDLVAKGLQDLDAGIVSTEALLVLSAKSRLEGLGFTVALPRGIPLPYEHALYEQLEQSHPNSAHSEYNALIGRIVSFAQAYVQYKARAGS